MLAAVSGVSMYIPNIIILFCDVGPISTTPRSAAFEFEFCSLWLVVLVGLLCFFLLSCSIF